METTTKDFKMGMKLIERQELRAFYLDGSEEAAEEGHPYKILYDALKEIES